jgi:glycosyltransferase involved in cell wall biosynthesis
VRVQAVVSGRLTASSRFRVLQHVGALRQLGVDVRAGPPRINKYAALPGRWQRRGSSTSAATTALDVAKLAVRTPAVLGSWRADVTWLEREMLPGRLSLEPFLGRPLLFDVDDAIWLLSPGHDHAAREIARRATCVLAGNDFLADWFTGNGCKVERIWTAVDTDTFKPRPRGGDRREGFVLGWTGSGSTTRYLEKIADPIGRFLATNPGSKLMVMADFAPQLRGIPKERVEFVRWDPFVEARTVASFDVGLMPIPDSDWARGKCSFKMLQYMACAVPSVVSPIGMNSQVMSMAEVGLAAHTDEQWLEALQFLHDEPKRAEELGTKGRELAERTFSVPVISRQLAGVMHRYG